MSSDETQHEVDWQAYEQEMCEYVKSDKWENVDDDGKETYKGVYLCLNLRLPEIKDTQYTPDELWKQVKIALATHQIRYNPYGATIDAVDTEGVNLGVTIDYDDFERVNALQDTFAVSNAIRKGQEYKPEDWKGKTMPFDYRNGKHSPTGPLMNNVLKNQNN